METTLLTKTRALNKTIHKGVDKPVDFEGVIRLVSELTVSQVILIGRRGRLLSRSDNYFDPNMIYQPKMGLDGKSLDEGENNWLLNILETKTDIVTGKDLNLTIVPVYGGGERLATLIFGKPGQSINEEDLVVFEYTATVTGLEILRLINERKEQKARERESLKLAMDVLSYSEKEAIKLIFHEVIGKEAFLVASNIAKAHGLTRSVIVNAIRKLESAGIVNARSLGMKGTHVRILNKYFLNEIQAV